MQWIGKSKRHDGPAAACAAQCPTDQAALTPQDRLLVASATLGPVGRIPFMPGTFGSLAAILVAPWLFIPLGWIDRFLLMAALFAFGGFAATRAEQHFGRPDPGCVVIDEVLGQWIACIPLAAASPLSLLIAFVLFRLFDIAKPFPVCWSETCLPHGYGIMIDDVVAGLYAALGLLLLGHFAHLPL